MLPFCQSGNVCELSLVYLTMMQKNAEECEEYQPRSSLKATTRFCTVQRLWIRGSFTRRHGPTKLKSRSSPMFENAP